MSEHPDRVFPYFTPIDVDSIVLTEEFLQDLEQAVDVTGNYF